PRTSPVPATGRPSTTRSSCSPPSTAQRTCPGTTRYPPPPRTSSTTPRPTRTTRPRPLTAPPRGASRHERRGDDRAGREVDRAARAEPHSAVVPRAERVGVQLPVPVVQRRHNVLGDHGRRA